ncbi:helix-turn-helix domain-containing protein [Mesobacillus zeae]|uniref:Transcriptional regulator n=1 Tax=Mesobacillus zeae TaxID=1917180 RepID=A0A398AWJ5_9BACI|nr:helix-turn-helix domain-containing protein [Mesobacillus zeae]RID81971.1 transcriptional regulator [Mesobacillus zeae]
MTNKAEILMHPVRMKIAQALMRNNEEGLTPLGMLDIIQDVPQATLYRHIQVMFDAGVLRIVKEKKIRSVSEKYYALNEDAARLDSEEWKKTSKEKKLNYISFYQLSLLTQYQNYLSTLEKKNSTEDQATFSLLELKIADQDFDSFHRELNDLMHKYYKLKKEDENLPTRTIAVTIIPES